MTRPIINTSQHQLVSNSQKHSMLKIIDFIDLCIPHFVIECASKNFIAHSLEDGFFHDFKMVASSECCEMEIFISFLFSHNFVMLKTDTMLDC